ncbi:uncharacterized protein [Miscanthus floridulus]|uniref:uncharacterized protein n=1 Tax=Miscanthus floridulus TaxID=154761 RepID=UPI00345765EF
MPAAATSAASATCTRAAGGGGEREEEERNRGGRRRKRRRRRKEEGGRRRKKESTSATPIVFLAAAGLPAPCRLDTAPTNYGNFFMNSGINQGILPRSSSSSVYLRGPASLPQRPIPHDRRPLIRPKGEKNWMIVASGGGHTRQVNGILGLLCKEHFPGLDEYAGVMGLAYLFDHYAAAPNAADRAHRLASHGG